MPASRSCDKKNSQRLELGADTLGVVGCLAQHLIVCVRCMVMHARRRIQSSESPMCTPLTIARCVFLRFNVTVARPLGLTMTASWPDAQGQGSLLFIVFRPASADRPHRPHRPRTRTVHTVPGLRQTTNGVLCHHQAFKVANFAHARLTRPGPVLDGTSSRIRHS